jgi:glycosyltransferase involved in cell wall biosynthesis
MRVLHVTPYFAPAWVYGGPPRSIIGLCKALLRAGVEIEVFTTDADGDATLPAAVTNDVEYDGVPDRYYQRTSRTFFTAPLLAPALRDVLSTVDLVHIHGLWNRVAWDAAREARRARVPYVVTTRGMLEGPALAHHAWRKRLAWALVERNNVACASLLHATSSREQTSLVQRFPQARVEMIPNGIELPARRTAFSSATRAELDLPADGPIVLFLGRIHPIKRLDLLAGAFRQLREMHPTARLVIAGPDEGEHWQTIEPLLASVAEQVTWMGPVDDEWKQKLLDVASMLVLCSDSESFGMSVVEAMGAAVPVVVTHTCPWPDVASHDTGYWVEQRADAVAEAMRRLLDRPHDARAKGERGRALVAAHYTWDAVARHMIDTYTQVLARVPVDAHPRPDSVAFGR